MSDILLLITLLNFGYRTSYRTCPIKLSVDIERKPESGHHSGINPDTLLGMIVWIE
jgi:hypothetical protein